MPSLSILIKEASSFRKFEFRDTVDTRYLMAYPKYSWRDVHTATEMEICILVNLSTGRSLRERRKEHFTCRGLRTLTREDFMCHALAINNKPLVFWSPRRYRPWKMDVSATPAYRYPITAVSSSVP